MLDLRIAHAKLGFLSIEYFRISSTFTNGSTDIAFCYSLPHNKSGQTLFPYYILISGINKIATLQKANNFDGRNKWYFTSQLYTLWIALFPGSPVLPWKVRKGLGMRLPYDNMLHSLLMFCNIKPFSPGSCTGKYSILRAAATRLV